MLETLVVSYDVNHQNGIGDITVVGDTVIHSFAPKDLSPLPKNIIFVIDVSGSMSGRKIEQTLEAMLTILDQLREEDMFMFILFESDLRYWPTINDEYEGEMIGPIDTVSDPYPVRPVPVRPSYPSPAVIGPRGTQTPTPTPPTTSNFNFNFISIYFQQRKTTSFWPKPTHTMAHRSTPSRYTSNPPNTKIPFSAFSTTSHSPAATSTRNKEYHGNGACHSW